MNVPIPGKESMKFNPECLATGTPIKYKYKMNDHYFLSLVRDYGPFFIMINNGHIQKTIELEEILDGSCEIVPLMSDDDVPLVIPCRVFNTNKIPIGSVYVDPDGSAFMVTDVDPFYLEIADHEGIRHDIQAEIFFKLDPEEISQSFLIYPPLYTEEIIKQGAEYKDRV